MVKNWYLWLDYYETRKGIGAVVFSAKGIKFLALPVERREQLDEMVLGRYPHCQYYNAGLLARLKRDLVAYFCGIETDFQSLGLGLDLEGFSDFKRSVYHAVQTIPYGKILSYQEVAKGIGRPLACRAVGNALSKNPIPVIIPCHRIVRSDDSLGGFSAGPEWKKKLLELEGLKVKAIKARE